MGYDVWFQRGTTAHDLYVHSLESQYQNGYRVYDPGFALSSDPLAYAKITRDPDIWRAVEYRKRKVAGIHWNVDPQGDSAADKLYASVVEKLLKKIHGFVGARATLAEAFLTGSKWAFIEGEQRIMTLGDGKPRLWWVPTRLKNVSRLRFVGKPEIDDDGRPWVRWQMYSLTTHQWELLEHPEWFAKLVYPDQEEETLGYGRGLIDSIYYYWRAAEIVLQEGLNGLERWSQGVLAAKVDGARDAENNLPNATVVQNWMDTLAKLRSRNVLVYDKQDEVEVITGGAEGNKIVMDFLRFLKTSITRAIEFGVLPTGGGEDVGSNARAEEESDSMEAAYQYDRELLSECLTRDLIGQVVRLNTANLEELGLGSAESPVFSIANKKSVDPSKEIGVITSALQAGIPLKKSEVYESIGKTMPNEAEDEVFEGGALSTAPSVGIDWPSPFAPREVSSTLSATGRATDSHHLSEIARLREQVESLLKSRASESHAPINVTVAPPAVTLNAPPVNVGCGVQEGALEAMMARVGDKLEAMGAKMAEAPAPVLHVPAPVVNVASPVVNVPAPVVNVHPTVAAPEVTVNVPAQERPIVNVTLEPEQEKSVEFTRNRDGQITGAEIREKRDEE